MTRVTVGAYAWLVLSGCAGPRLAPAVEPHTSSRQSVEAKSQRSSLAAPDDAPTATGSTAGLPRETLTLEEAVRAALAKSPRIEEARAEMESAQASVSLARSGYVPDLNLAAAATAGFGGSTTSAMGVRGIMGSPNAQHFGAGIEGAWTVYDFGRTSSRVDAALAGVDAASARMTLSQRATALEVVRAFGAAMIAEENVRATAAVIDLRARGADAARALATAGLRPDVDALLATARAEEARAALASASAEVEAARARLGALLERRIPETVVLTAPEPSKADAERATAAVPPAARDPLHGVARAEEARADALERAETSEHLPRLVVAGSAGYARRDPPDEPGYWAAGVGVVVPLLSFVREGAKAREAAAAARAAGARASQADIELAAQLGAEAASLRALSGSLAAADASLAAAKAALEAAEARYGAGQLSFAEVDAARDAFVRIESSRRQFGLVAAFTLARLRIWSGAAGTPGQASR